MTESLFTALEQVLLPHESLKFSIIRGQTGLVILLQPSLDKARDVPKEAEQVRAVLGMPLRLAGSASELDAAFTARVRGYADARRGAHDSYKTLIDALNEASKEAKSKTPARGSTTKPKTASPPLPTHEKPARASEAPAEAQPTPAPGSAPAVADSTAQAVMQPQSLF